MATEHPVELTHYSERIDGAEENHNWAVSFDTTRGTVGINQFDDDSKLADRVLLSRQQVKALMAFVAKRHRA